jgi:hypothetical protein
VRFSLSLVLLLALVSPARAQFRSFIEIYNSGVLTLGADQTLLVTIVNDNNVADPALPALSAPDEACSIVAQFLDGKGNVLQKQQQTLQPGQSVSFRQSGQQTVQARVDISPGTASGFASTIAGQCVVSDEILDGSSGDPILFPPLLNSRVEPPPDVCKPGCRDACFNTCHSRGGDRDCFGKCIEICGRRC